MSPEEREDVRKQLRYQRAVVRHDGPKRRSGRHVCQVRVMFPVAVPPRGTVTANSHRASLSIEGVHYPFLALGSLNWIFAKDRVSFDFVTPSEGYHNIQRWTIRTFGKNGKAVTRGICGSMPKLRTATARLPDRRREFLS